MDFVIEESGMTREEAQETIDNILDAQDFINDHLDDFETLQNITDLQLDSEVMNQTKTVQKIGQLMCGDEDAFFVIANSGYVFQDMNKNESDANKVASEPDACEKIDVKMQETDVGRFIWKMLQPFLKGRILYTPMDEFTQTIIQKVSRKTLKIL